MSFPFSPAAQKCYTVAFKLDAQRYYDMIDVVEYFCSSVMMSHWR